MKKELKKLFSGIFVVFILSSCTAPNITNNDTNKIKSIVRFNDNIKNISQTALSLKMDNFRILSKELKIGEFYTLPSNLDKIKQNPEIKYVEPDQKMEIYSFETFPFSTKQEAIKPNDTFFGLQWNIEAINANKAWTITQGSKNVVVAVIDSGVDPDHPDLKDNLLPLIDVWSESGSEDIYTANGRKVNFSGKDGNGHGTHVAGIIGALINNGQGIAGIAGNIKILPIKSTSNNGETSASVITASILKAIENKANVINISIGGRKSEGTQALLDAVNLAISKNIVFVSATGNESRRSSGFVEEVTVPAAYPGVFAVGASTKTNRVANYSNGGSEIDILAPGGENGNNQLKIYSTWPTYDTAETYRSGVRGPYAILSGTSMSSPHVAAAAALLLSKEPNLNPQQVRVRILSTSQDTGSKGFDTASGYGVIDTYKMLITNSHSSK